MHRFITSGSGSEPVSLSKRAYFKIDPDSDADTDADGFYREYADNYETVIKIRSALLLRQ